MFVCLSIKKCHSFRIIIIPSVLFLFLPYYCHSYQIISFLPNHCHFKYLSSWLAPLPSHTRRGKKYLRVLLKSNLFLLASPRFWDLPMVLDRLKERSMARNESEASKSPFHVCDAKRLVVWLAYLWPLPPPKTSLVKKRSWVPCLLGGSHPLFHDFWAHTKREDFLNWISIQICRIFI